MTNQLTPKDELMRDAEATLAKETPPGEARLIAISVDTTPTLYGEVRYALAAMGHETTFYVTSMANVLNHLEVIFDGLKRECPDGFNEEKFDQQRKQLVESFNNTIVEIKRRLEAERGD